MMELGRDDRRIFLALLLAAAVARIFAFDAYSMHAPDETIQYLEQAHRRVFDYGLVPWEYRYFIRSWLIPLLIVPLMQLGEWLDPGGTLYLIMPRAVFAVFNMAPVVAAWFIGKRISRDHAIVAMAVTGLWVEFVLFSVQMLSESLAVSCFFIAVALIHRREASTRALAIAGAMMALACIFRFQFGPAIAVYGAMVAGRDLRAWKGLMLGAIPVVIAGGALDLAMGLWPYEWILNNYQMNIAAGKMKEIGGVSHDHYLFAISHYWFLAAVPIVTFAALRWKLDKALLIAALVNLIVHQLIGHKEYRYLWLSSSIVLLVAAFGSVDYLKGSAKRGWRKFYQDNAALVAGTCWVLVSLLYATSPTYRLDWRKSGEPSRLAATALKNDKVCGIAVPRGPYFRWGYSLLHQNKPVHLLGVGAPPSRMIPADASSGFNAMLVWANEPQPNGFPIKGPCLGNIRDRACLYFRRGGCERNEASKALETQEVLNFLDM